MVFEKCQYISNDEAYYNTVVNSDEMYRYHIRGK